MCTEKWFLYKKSQMFPFWCQSDPLLGQIWHPRAADKFITHRSRSTRGQRCNWLPWPLSDLDIADLDSTNPVRQWPTHPLSRPMVRQWPTAHLISTCPLASIVVINWVVLLTWWLIDYRERLWRHVLTDGYKHGEQNGRYRYLKLSPCFRFWLLRRKII